MDGDGDGRDDQGCDDGGDDNDDDADDELCSHLLTVGTMSQRSKADIIINVVKIIQAVRKDDTVDPDT